MCAFVCMVCVHAHVRACGVYVFAYVHVFMCEFVCVCVCERETEYVLLTHTFILCAVEHHVTLLKLQKVDQIKKVTSPGTKDKMTMILDGVDVVVGGAADVVEAAGVK